MDSPAPSTAPTARDDELVSRRLARTSLVDMYAVLRAMSLYPVRHTAVRSALQGSYDSLMASLKLDGSLDLRVQRDTATVSGVRISRELETYASLPALLRTLGQSGVGQVAVDSEVTLEEWSNFLEILVRNEQVRGTPEERYARLLEQLEKVSILSIKTAPATDIRDDDEISTEDRKMGARRSYTASVSAFKKVIGEARLGRIGGRRELKRAVQSLVDQIMTGESALLGMTTLRDHDSYTYTHSVNVAVFALAVGRRLGCDRRQLYDLALCGLFHDLGKSKTPLAILQKPGKLEPQEWETMKEHPWQGAVLLAAMYAPDAMPLHAVTVAHEHHMKTDLTGYPAVIRPRSQILFSKIIAVCDAFDAGTSRRIYQDTQLEPGNVLREMLTESKWGMDRLVVKALIQTLGIYPVGTLVVLDTYELAVVKEANPIAEHLSRPLVVVIADADGNLLPTPLEVDLSERGPDGDSFTRSIISMADPERAHVRTADYIP
jgi:putative nucleotidyltransferase with HDIG domain